MNERELGCPNCRAERLPDKDQPYPGSHAFSIKYKCGAQVVYVISGKYWEYENECKVEMLDDGK
jgi:hypothetical protein